MANMTYLEESVAKAKAKVLKCEATIARQEKGLAKKVAALPSGVTVENMEESKWEYGEGGRRGSSLYWPIVEVERKMDDLKGAKKNLEAAKEVLASWEAKLAKEQEKERFLSDNAPAVIVEFLARWKAMTYEWYIRAYARYVELEKELEAARLEAMIEAAETLPEYARYRDEGGTLRGYYKTAQELINLLPREPMKKYLLERELTQTQIKERLGGFGFIVVRMTTFYKESERLAWLEKTLEEERKAKMLDLIERVNKVVGSITDASGLKINEKGNLDGIVIGEKATARVETIGAGGWNIQCFHYRTLVNKLK